MRIVYTNHLGTTFFNSSWGAFCQPLQAVIRNEAASQVAVMVLLLQQVYSLMRKTGEMAHMPSPLTLSLAGGKSDDNLHLPLNSSVSVTLHQDQVCLHEGLLHLWMYLHNTL